MYFENNGEMLVENVNARKLKNVEFLLGNLHTSENAVS